MKTLVLLSGGLKSCLLMSVALKEHEGRHQELGALFFEHGQRNLIPEKTAATRIANYHKTSIAFRELPKPHSPGWPPFKVTVMLSMAFQYAVEHKFDRIYWGVGPSNHPECKFEYYELLTALQYQALNKRTRSMHKIHQIEWEIPLIQLTLDQVVTLGISKQFMFNAPFELAFDCLKPIAMAGGNGYLLCGTCAGCRNKRKAFHINGVPDPHDPIKSHTHYSLKYRSVDPESGMGIDETDREQDSVDGFGGL